VDRQHVDGGAPSLDAAWGFEGLPAWGSLYAVE
jgi:hypothetical protein